MATTVTGIVTGHQPQWDAKKQLVAATCMAPRAVLALTS